MKDFSILKKQNPIADFHCDLLLYLQNDSTRSAHDLAPRCGISQLKQGNVKIQTMAIFSETAERSSEKGLNQAEIFKNLPKLYPDSFRIIHDAETLQAIEHSSQIGIIPAVENASSICDEQEDLEKALDRFHSLQRHIGKVAYLSLTWNTENRFGGGAHTKIGLKADGKRIIDFLNSKHIALDLSHASDNLAYESLNYIDKKAFTLPVIASHSNFRYIHNVPRNLPDDLAKEILRRNGMIGLNFIRPFVGESSINNFTLQLEHALKFEKNKGVCIGADFFFENDATTNYGPNELFFPGYDHAGTYTKVLNLWKEALPTEQALEDICFKNLQRFLLKNIYNN